MKRLTDQQIEAYRTEIVNNWESHTLNSLPARFEAPLGELVSSLAGFAWAWKLQGFVPKIAPITKTDRFNAQGLEGKIVIETDLSTAIVYASQCPSHRYAIYA